MNELLIGAALTAIISIIGYFLKRTINRVDKHDMDMEKMREQYVKEADNDKNILELKEDIKQIRNDYTPIRTHTKELDECRSDIKQIKEDYIMKEDFYRELNKVDKKLDNITNMLLDVFQKGGRN